MDNNKQILHFRDDGLTLRQTAAFALASNWADRQYKHVMASDHATRLYRYATPIEKESVAHYRNHFSHAHRSQLPLVWQDKEVADRLHTLVRDSAHMMIQREGKKWADDEKEHHAIQRILQNMENDSAYGFDFKDDKHAWLHIALVLSPFLQKGQMAFLWGKLTAQRRKEQEARDKARYALLQFLAISDSALAIEPQEEEERLFSVNTEHGLALLVTLKDSVDKMTGQEAERDVTLFSQGDYIMRQLILFLDREDMLPSVAFARTHTHIEGERDGKPILTQETIFTREKEARTHDGTPLPPLLIKGNTIRVTIQGNNKGKIWQGMMGIHTLSFLVCAALLDKDVDRLVVDWYQQHGDKNDWGRDKGTAPPTPDKIEQRIDMHIGRMEGAKTLHRKIGMIADLIHESYREKHGSAMSTSDYRDLLYHIRHYRLHNVRAMLHKDYGIETMKVSMTDKPWSFILKKERLEDQYDEIVYHRCRWLEKLRVRCHTMDDGTRLTHAHMLGVRGLPTQDGTPRGTSKPAFFPVGMPMEAVRDFYPEFRMGHPDDKDAKKRHFIDVMRDNKRLRQGDGIPTDPFGFTWSKSDGTDKAQGESLRAITKRRTQWAYATLLHMMARHMLRSSYAVEDVSRHKKGKETPHDGRDKNPVSLGQMPFETLKPSALSMELEVEKGKKKVVCHLTQGWRNYARYDKDTMGKVVKAYTKIGKGDTWSIALLRSEEKRKGESVEQALVEMRRQRFIAAQAILQWEKEVLKGHTLKADDGGYISFPTILDHAKIQDSDKRDALEEYRNYVFHDNVLDEPFCHAPEPLRGYYDKIDEEEKKRREEKRKQAMKGKHASSRFHAHHGRKKMPKKRMKKH